ETNRMLVYSSRGIVEIHTGFSPLQAFDLASSIATCRFLAFANLARNVLGRSCHQPAGHHDEGTKQHQHEPGTKQHLNDRNTCDVASGKERASVTRRRFERVYAMARVDVAVLGGFHVRRSAGVGLALPLKAQALLAYLAVRPGQRHPRDKLTALLWGGRPEAQARDSLRHTLGALRKALDTPDARAVIAEGQSFALEPAAVGIDVVSFERHVASGTPQALETAAAPYQGDLLEGIGVSEARFEEWLLAERERLRELALEALAKLLGHQLRVGVTDRAIQTATRLLALDPLQETVHRTLMRLYVQQ